MQNLNNPEAARGNGPAIFTQSLSKKFIEEYAVENLSFQVARGHIFGLIGPSGCGKTTTVRLLTGIYEPTSGNVAVLGKDPKKFSAKTREKIGYMPQLFVLYPDLSVRENMSFAASLYGMGLTRWKQINDLLEFVELKDHQNKLARNISGGMQRRLALAATLVHKPELIFLDEPTAGIDPVLRAKFWEHFKQLKSQNRTIIVTTQYVGEAAYCDYVGIMSAGHLLVVDTPIGLRRKAFGGEILEMQTKEAIQFTTGQEIQNLPFVRGRIRYIGNNHLQIIVEDASTAIPEMIQWCHDHGLTVDTINEFVPPFDDVFIQIIQAEGIHV